MNAKSIQEILDRVEELKTMVKSQYHIDLLTELANDLQGLKLGDRVNKEAKEALQYADE